MRRPLLALLPLFLVACERQPAAPAQVMRPGLQATRSEVTSIFDLVDDPSDCTANPRLGEVLLFSGRITIVQYTTTASSGNANTTAFSTYDPAVHLVGQTSGHLWTIDAGRTHPVYHDNFHGAGESFESVTNEYYTDSSGAQLHLRANSHLTITGQGRVTLDRPVVWECIGG